MIFLFICLISAICLTSADDKFIDMSTFDYAIKEQFDDLQITFKTRFENIKLTIDCSDCIKSDKINSIKCDQVDVLQTNIQFEMRNKLIKTPFNASCKRTEKNIYSIKQINTQTDTKSISASWQSPSNDTIYYLLYLIDKTGQYIHRIINNSSFLFDNLNEKSLYQICIATINNKWITSLFTCKQILTDFLSTGPVTNINVSADIDKIYLSWEKPEYKHDIPQGYIVHLRSDDTKLCRIIIISMTNSQITNTDQSCRNEQHKIWRELLQLEIDNLPSYSRFTISITPINNNKNAVNEYRSIQTKEGESESVKEIKINAIHSGYVGIEFKEPSQPNGKVIKYRIRIILIKINICTNNTFDIIYDKYSEKLYNSIAINIFKQCGSYLLEISPINGWHLKKGEGKSAVVSFRYPMGKQGIPISIYTQFLDENSIVLHLNQSQNINQCFPTGYILALINEKNASDCTIQVFTNTHCDQLKNELKNQFGDVTYLRLNGTTVTAVFNGLSENRTKYKYKIYMITDQIEEINSNKHVQPILRPLLIFIGVSLGIVLIGIAAFFSKLLFIKLFNHSSEKLYFTGKSNIQTGKQMILDKEITSLNLVNVISSNTIKSYFKIKQEYSIPINQFCTKYKNHKLNAFKQIFIEYSMLISESKSFNEKMRKKSINRRDKYFKEIVLIDKYRVKLKSVKMDKDILNASYIPFVNDDTKMEYIVSHNPIIDNVHIFWEMIWNENINFIILLTKMTSNGIFDCIQYWPSKVGQSNYYGNNNQYTVSLEEEIDQGCYYERSFVIENQNVFRIIRQLHMYKYIDFPLENFEELDKLMYRFHAITNDAMSPPYLIHCSTQVNTSAIIICIDQILKQLKNGSDKINIFNTCFRLQIIRDFAITTQFQYALIYSFMDYFVKEYFNNYESINKVYYNM